MLFTALLTQMVVDLLVRQLIDGTRYKTQNISEELSISSPDDYYNWLKETNQDIVFDTLKKCVSYPIPFSNAEEKLHKTLKKRILKSFLVERMDGKGRFILRQLWKAYVTNPQQLPDRAILRLIETVQIPAFRDVSLRERLDSSEKIGRAREALTKVNKIAQHRMVQKALTRIICDHIAGMTDEMALEEHRRLYSSHEEVKELR